MKNNVEWRTMGWLNERCHLRCVRWGFNCGGVGGSMSLLKVAEVILRPTRFNMWVHKKLDWYTYTCMFCNDHDEDHEGLAAILTRLRDRDIIKSIKKTGRLEKQPKWMKNVRCVFGGHGYISLNTGMCENCNKEVIDGWIKT